jgi:hypothetical protein
MMMTTPSRDYRPLSGLSAELNRVASDLSALCVIAADESGYVLDTSKTDQVLDPQTLAALGTANLVSSMQLLSLAYSSFAETGALIGIVENDQVCLIVAGKKNGPVFISLLGDQSPLGLARLEMRELANIDWEFPIHNLDNDRLYIDQQLASRNLSDELFAFGDEEK